MNIQVGDLVMMVRCPCGCCTAPLGVPFRVTSIDPRTLPVHCNNDHNYVVGHGPIALGFGTWHIPTSLVKKIDPPPLTEDTPTDEDLTA